MTVINFTIDRLTPKKIKGKCTGWSVFPRPGSFIDFFTLDNRHFYAQVESVTPDADDSNVLMLTLILVSGTPDTKIREVKQIGSVDFYKTLQKDGFFPTISLELFGLTLDMKDAGGVIYIKPDERGLHKTIIQSLVQAGLPVLVLDPLGLEWEFIKAARFSLGKDLSLSIQEIGVSRFVEWIVDELPQTVQLEASRLLLSLIPPTPDFIPLQYFVHHPLLKNHPLSSVIMHQLYKFHTNQVFASSPRHALTAQLLKEGGVIDFSSVAPEMLSRTYEGLLEIIRRHPLSSRMQVVLVAPEIVPQASNSFILQVKNPVFIVSKIARPWQDHISDRFEEINVWGEQGIEIDGRIIGDLSLFLPYITQKEIIEKTEEEQSVAQPDVEVQEQSFTSDIPELNLEAFTQPVVEEEQSVAQPDVEVQEQSFTSDIPELNLEAFTQPVVEEEHAVVQPDVEAQEQSFTSDIPELNLEAFTQPVVEEEQPVAQPDVEAQEQSFMSDLVELNIESFVQPVAEEADHVKEDNYIEPPAFSMEYFMDRETVADFEQYNDVDLSYSSSSCTIDESQRYNIPTEEEFTISPDTNIFEELPEDNVFSADINDPVVIDTKKLWDMDLSLITSSSDSKYNSDNEFYLLLHKEIPSITKGIPMIAFIPEESDLQFKDKVASLDMEGDMIGNIAPDLIEKVHEKQLESVPENQVALEAEYQSGSTTTSHAIKVQGDVNIDNEDALAYLNNILSSSSSDTNQYSDNSADNPSESYYVEEHVPDKATDDTDNEQLQYIKDLMETSNQDFSHTAPVYTIDEGTLVDTSLPPGFAETLNLEESVFLEEPVQEQREPVKDRSLILEEETFNLTMSNDQDTNDNINLASSEETPAISFDLETPMQPAKHQEAPAVSFDLETPMQPAKHQDTPAVSFDLETPTQPVEHQETPAVSFDLETPMQPAEHQDTLEDAFALIHEDLPDFSLDLDFEPEPEQSVISSVQQAVPLETVDLSLDLDFALDYEETNKPIPVSKPKASSSETDNLPLPVYKSDISDRLNLEFKPGEFVFHQRYGEGVIKKVISMDEKQVILNINFKGFGKRLLDPSLTQLEKVS